MRIALFLLLLLTLGGCVPTNLDTPQPRLDIVAPLLKTRLDINSSEQFADLFYEKLLSAGDLNQTSGKVEPFEYASLGPFEIRNRGGEFIEARLNRSKLEFVIRNEFPFTLDAGMTLVYLDEGGTELLRQPLSRAIPANGTLQGVEQAVENKLIAGRLFLKLENVKSSGTSNPVNLTGQVLSVGVRFTEVDAAHATFDAQQLYYADETSKLDLDEIEGDEPEGQLILRTTNSLPFPFQVQAYLLAADKITVLDSLFKDGPYRSEGGSVDNPVEGRETWPINSRNIDLLNRSEYLHIVGSTTRFGRQYTLTSAEALDLQIVADINVTVK